MQAPYHFIRHPETFEHCMDRLLKALHNQSMHPARLQWYLEDLYIQIKEEQLLPDIEDEKNNMLKSIAQEIEHFPSKQYDFKHIAATHYLSYTSFRNLFRKHIELPPSNT